MLRAARSEAAGFGARHLLDPPVDAVQADMQQDGAGIRVANLHMLPARCGISQRAPVTSCSRLSPLVTFGRHADARRSRLAAARRAAASPEPGLKRGTRAARTRPFDLPLRDGRKAQGREASPARMGAL